MTEKPDPLAVAYKQGWTTARNEWKPRAEKAEAEIERLRQIITGVTRSPWRDPQ